MILNVGVTPDDGVIQFPATKSSTVNKLPDIPAPVGKAVAESDGVGPGQWEQGQYDGDDDHHRRVRCHAATV